MNRLLVSEECPFPYKHTTCIPRWNDVETTVFTLFQRGIHVLCLRIYWKITFKGTYSGFWKIARQLLKCDKQMYKILLWIRSNLKTLHLSEAHLEPTQTSRWAKVIYMRCFAEFCTRCFFYKQRFFFNSASVLLKVFINWASNVA